MKTVPAILTMTLLYPATPFATDFQLVTCEGMYPPHLQGVCADEKDAIFWSFTTKLVKTDRSGKVVKQVDVANHHGDLCFHQGKVFAALSSTTRRGMPIPGFTSTTPAIFPAWASIRRPKFSTGRAASPFTMERSWWSGACPTT